MNCDDRMQFFSNDRELNNLITCRLSEYIAVELEIIIFIMCLGLQSTEIKAIAYDIAC